MPKVVGVKARVIVPVAFTRKRKTRRHAVVVLVPLGEDAHANLVKWTRLERSERLLLALFALVHPCVTGRSEWKVRRTVGVPEMKRIADADRTAIPSAGRDH